MCSRLCFSSAMAFAFVLSMHSNADSLKETMPKDDLYTNGSSCSYYKKHLNSFVKEGALDRGELLSTVPRVPVSFKSGDKRVMASMRLADLNRDGVTELIYIVDITSPYHIETKVYILDSLSEDVARSLIDNKFKSPYHKSLMKKMTDKFVWDPISDINDESVRLSLSEHILKFKKADDPWRLSLAHIDNEFYLVADGVQSKTLVLARFAAEETITQEVVCVFNDLLY
ncbi:hypothetical protein Rhein_1517 [Rheinheimera sp. A13L]|uniref:hypothetical protein n=1 Tax=Rheinheimera sp. A13L TaxID=506534 RepID=UPI00021252F6|nr:hypothetical protein [Rheinheimera sp. A13L]EGM78100.1 hypothetical protein Rhein_1517 [Rheinheimera sp. A13L]